MAKKDIRIESAGRLTKLAKALGNGLRIEIILAHANDGPASATNLARSGAGRPNTNMTYRPLVCSREVEHSG
jgi:hypothetical protein